MGDHDKVHDMVIYIFLKATTIIADEIRNIKEPNLDAQRFYKMLVDANQPIYIGCTVGFSKRSLADRMMNIKLIIRIAWMDGPSCLKSIC